MATTDLRGFVEAALGYRVVRIGKRHEYSSGIQRQWVKHTIKDGKPVEEVVKVVPAEEHELQMFNMLCKPQEQWGLPDGEA